MARETALYEIPKTLEVARVLDDSVLAKYNDSVKSYNSDKARAVLSKFGKADRELTGSNPFMLVHLQNSGLIKDRIATRQDLETALSFGLDISRNYVDFGLALRTARDSYSPNDLPAKTLAGELSQRGIKLGKGKLIPISALTLSENPDSAYGLVFNLKEDAKEFEDLSQFKWNWQKQGGLPRACFYWCLWYSDAGDLANSNGYGRVVVVSGKATAKNFLDAKLKELRRLRNVEVARVQDRYTQARKLLLEE